ncbi:molybdenum cofactor guanylyltransferase MobA [Microvirga zambiensis]|uniref:molybdenum cofactor guanylyltransferase MobA n=1 Tax=Microvirga zambiensis TaxID=1402137 RepID=UPI00191FA55F|nr:molybdenum cofactor guanylyltransferase MobA [Microvirga zambiensis]
MMPPTLGVILAGGLSRRMGGVEKSLLDLGDRTLIAHVAERLAPQCENLMINANGSSSRFDTMGLPVVPDVVPGHQGPLAGILTALEWTAAHRPGVEWVVSVPSDTPFIPKDLVRRLHEALQKGQHPLACASSDGRLHFAVGLWPVSLRDDLRQAIVDKGLRSIRDWTSLHGCAEATWPVETIDPFFNINTPDDLVQATIWLSEDIPDDRA